MNLVRAGTHEAPERAVPVEVSGTVLRDLLIHDFDAVRSVTGSEGVAVTTAGVEGHAGVGDGRDWPAVASLIELADGSAAGITGGRPNPPGYDARLEVYGSAASAATGLDVRTPAHPRGAGDPAAYSGFADRFSSRTARRSRPSSRPWSATARTHAGGTTPTRRSGCPWPPSGRSTSAGESRWPKCGRKPVT